MDVKWKEMLNIPELGGVMNVKIQARVHSGHPRATPSGPYEGPHAEVEVFCPHCGQNLYEYISEEQLDKLEEFAFEKADRKLEALKSEASGANRR